MNPSSYLSTLEQLAQVRRSAAQPTISSSSNAPYLFLFLEIFEREGGIQSFVRQIFRSLAALEPVPSADVFLLRDRCCEHPFASPALRFHYFKTRSALLSRLWIIGALLLYLLRHRPQRLICGHLYLAPLVWLCCKPFGIPYTVITHGKEVWAPLPCWQRLALQQADQIWTVSRYSRDRSAASNQLDLSKIQLLPCAIDGDAFTPAAKSPALLEQYGLRDAKVLMTVARLWSGDIYKGVDVTLRALPQILQSFPEVKYLVVGRGDDQPRLAELAAELGIADRVVFAGFVATADLLEHYRLADAYVMPSQEGFGIVYLEAMACGIPVLSGDADGSADPLRDGELGWRVPHRDPEAVAQACLEMLQAIAQRQRGAAFDPRCDGSWLRRQAIERFGKAAFTARLQVLLGSG
ncbi:MAG: glycosyltransferase [Pegethrix bostrychoides GSE-TBD4-15B]|jgi:glycosyltransferase involved in cell wall biosynthesis|uniref:Glycosyltransferase n=1 Tax=Pegethrix bostrychoides GSE-TBD4-15B TaxID=2839662 RepID=A0A951PF36_9CYAN|nr:glycosyltransferase [Pegethrix bostrychoides GSE-TBD4-15B]